MDDLGEIYYDPRHHASYSGSTKLIEDLKGKVSKDDVIDWLRKQDAYTLHRPVRRKFPRRHYNLHDINEVWEADLTDYRAFKEYNDNYSYLLCVIDCVSKRAWVEPLKNKTAEVVLDGFKSIFSRSEKNKPYCIQSDKGAEFINSKITAFFQKQNINFRTARSPDVKASVCERFQKTLKERIQRYFTYKNTRRYIDVLQQIVDSYNETKHSSTKMKPAAVTSANAHEAVRNIRKRFKDPPPRKPKYAVGQYVRISRAKGVFAKGYEAGYTEEIFIITKINQTRTPHVYEIKDQAGEIIDGFFYEQELSPVNKNLEEEEFLIDKVIKRKGKGKNAQVFVSWRGYPAKFNSWIPASDIKDVA